jgi:hypothetical protein
VRDISVDHVSARLGAARAKTDTVLLTHRRQTQIHALVEQRPFETLRAKHEVAHRRRAGERPGQGFQAVRTSEHWREKASFWQGKAGGKIGRGVCSFQQKETSMFRTISIACLALAIATPAYAKKAQNWYYLDMSGVCALASETAAAASPALAMANAERSHWKTELIDNGDEVVIHDIDLDMRDFYFRTMAACQSHALPPAGEYDDYR